VFIEIEEGYGAGFVPAFDGVDFIAPYGGSIVFSTSDGYSGYDISIVKDGYWALGEIGVSILMDGYEGPVNRVPPPNAFDVPRTTSISFRVRVPAGPTTPPIFEGLGGWTD
jgi:hypothetical protein